MNRGMRYQVAVATMIVIGLVGTVVGVLYAFNPGIIAFFAVIGIGGGAVLVGGETYVAPVFLVIGVFAAVISVGNIAVNGISSLSLLFAMLAIAALARGYQYHRAYST